MRRRQARLPEEQQKALAHARRLEAVWLVVLASIVVAIYYSLGNSQAMRTAWIEDMLSFVPPVAFLVSSWIESWSANDRFPLGFVRVTSIGYLVSAVSIGGVGAYLIVDSAMALIHAEHPTIGSVEMFGVTFWFGWVMIAALLYSVVLPVIFGRLKMKPARILHDKVLWADAVMNKADWMTGAAAAVGVVGIGFGLWWADAVAAILIALDVLHDGFKHAGAAVRDLSDEMPRTVDDKEFDPVIERMAGAVDTLDWVRRSRVRLREEGRFIAAVVYVVPSGRSVDPGEIQAAERQLRALDWRIHDVAITPVRDLAGVPGGRSR